MGVSRFLGRGLLCLGIAVWVGLTASSPGLARAGLQLGVRVGMGGAPVEDAYNPVFLTLDPPPDPGTQVAITVTLLTSKEWYSDPSRARLPVSHHRFQLAYPGPDQALAVPVPLDETVLRLRVEVETEDGSRASRIVNRPDFFGRRMLVLTTRRQALSFLADTLGALVVSEPRLLPADWRCYDGINKLVLDDLRLADLPPAARSALRQAVESHMGVLVTGPGLRANQGDSLLAPLDAVRVIGEGEPEFQGGLAEWLAGRVEDAGGMQPLSLLHLANAEGVALVHSNGQPAVLRRRGPRGFVVICAFDPVRLAWESPDASYQARSSALEYLLTLAAEGPGVYAQPGELVESLVPREARMSGMVVPIIVLLAVFAVALGPVNFLVVRRARRREWMLVTVPVMVAVFLVAAVIVSRASFGRQDILCTQSTLVAAADQDKALELTQFGRLSRQQAPLSFVLPAGVRAAPPKRSRYALFNPAQLELKPVSWTEGSDGLLTASNVWQRPRSMRFFGVERVVQIPAPIAEVHLEGEELVGTFTNTFGYPLEDAVVMVKWNSMPLGHIAPGETRHFRVKLGPPEKYVDVGGNAIDYTRAVTWVEYLPQEQAPEPDSPRGEFLRALVYRSRQDFEEPVLLAWGEPKPAVDSPGATRSDMALVVVRIPVTPGDDVRVLVPPGVAARLWDFSFGMLPPKAYSTEQSVGRTAIYHLPIAPVTLSDCTLTIHFYATGPRWMPDALGPPLSLFDWRKGEWERIAESTKKKGDICLSDAGRFVKQPEGLVAVQIEEEGDEYIAECSDLSCFAGRYTTISYLDVSLEGRRK